MGAKHPKEILQLICTLSRRDKFRALADEHMALRIATNAREFARRFLSDGAISEHVAMLVQRYLRLLRATV